MRWSVGLIALFLASFSLAGCTESKDGTDWGDYAWGLPERIDQQGGVSDPKLAVSASGIAVAVWTRWDGAVWANEYSPGNGWGVAEAIEGTAESYAYNPDVAIDPSGDAMAVWEAGGTPAQIMASRYRHGSGWEPAGPIDPGASPDSYPQKPRVGMDANGNAIVTWLESGAGSTIVAAHQTSAGGWGVPERIDDESTGYPYEPRGVVIDPSGMAIAIWTGEDQQGGALFANLFMPTEGWQTPEAIDDPEPTWIEGAEIAMDGSGNAIVVWRQDYWEGEPASLISANRFTPTGGWGSAAPIENGPFYSREPHVAMNDNGTAMVVWLRSAHGVDPVSGIWSLRFTPTEGWDSEPAPVHILGDWSTQDAYPQVALDPRDNALVVWHAYGSREGEIWSSHHDPDAGWDAAVVLSFAGLGGDRRTPKVGVDRTGKGTAIWYESGFSDSTVVASRYDDTPPQSDPAPTWQAICDATCARAEECSLDDAECVSACIADLSIRPCDPNEGALELCLDDLGDLSCQDLEYGFLPYSCAHACVGDRLCEGRTCNDENPCTDDACDPSDGSCFATAVEDGTPCATDGACTDGRCVAEFPCTEQGILDAIEVGGGPNTFDCAEPKTIKTTAPIVVERSVILDGEGKLTVDGDGRHTVFQVWSDGAIPGQPYSVELQQMTITGGRGSNGGIMNAGTLRLVNCTVTGNEGDQRGGGIDNTGTLALDYSTVSENSARWGGGISNWNGTLTINNSTVSGNQATEGIGGGIDNRASLTISDSTISENMAMSRGGGISNSGILTVNNSTISNNAAASYLGGGGVYNGEDFEPMGTATLTNTVLTGNEAYNGGGIGNRATMTLVDCTVSENFARERGPGINNDGTMTVIGSTVARNLGEGPEPDPEPMTANGGGFHNLGTLTLVNSTVSGNMVDGTGAGILNAGTLTLASCTLSGNTSSWDNGISGGSMSIRNTIIDGDCRNVASDSRGGNVESPGDTCGLDSGSDQTGISAIRLSLGALANNGGPTDTHALQSGSDAINAVPDGGCVDAQERPLEVDQRGVERPQGAACDAGSFELEQ